jgi:hypothetical protein
MSLLMDALKQQAGAQPDASSGSPVSAVSYVEVPAPAQGGMPRWLMFLLAGSAILGIGVSSGLVLHQLLQSKPVVEPVASSSSMPAASPGLILSDLLAKPTSEEQAAQAQQEAEQAQLVVSAEIPLDAEAGQTLDQQVDTVVGEQQLAEEFPAGKVLGAARQMREADPAATVDSYDGQSSQQKDYGQLPAAELSSDQVPQELKDKFQFAVDSLANEPQKSKINEFAAPARDISSLDDVIQRQIPPIRFQAHVYASEPKQRWVKVNGKDLQEGQWITADIQLKEITPQYVLLQTGRQLFSMQALSEWSYRLKTKP